MQDTPAPAIYDVLIAGGGTAGILAAARLAASYPGLKIALLERDRTLGGRMRGSSPEAQVHGYGLSAGSDDLFRVWQQTLQDLGASADDIAALPTQRQQSLGILASGKIAQQPIEEWFCPKGARLLGGLTASRQWGEVEEIMRQGATAGAGSKLTDTTAIGKVASVAGATALRRLAEGATADASAANDAPAAADATNDSETAITTDTASASASRTPGRKGAAGKAGATKVNKTAAKAAEADDNDGMGDDDELEDTGAGRSHAFSHYWKQPRKVPAAIVLEHFATTVGIPDIWGAATSALADRAAFHGSRLHSGVWAEMLEILAAQPAFQHAVHVETENRLLNADLVDGLWNVSAEKGQYQARTLIVAQSPWQAAQWLKRSLWPTHLLQVASKTKPVSMVVLTEHLRPAADATRDIPDVTIVPAERVQIIRTGAHELCFQATIDYELSLQAPAVIKAVKALKRARKKLQLLCPDAVSESGHVALLPVAWAQSPMHSDRRYLEKLEKKSIQSPTLAFCGDAYGARYDGDANLIHSLMQATTAVSTAFKNDARIKSESKSSPGDAATDAAL